MNKYYILTIISFLITTFNIYPNISTDKYLLLTLKGNINESSITMHIKIKNPDNINENKSVSIKGHYKYDDINTPIKLEGSINKKSITFKANGNEIFSFILNEDQIYNILNNQNEIYINLNGKWRKKDEMYNCNIKTVKFVHSIYEIYIEKKYKENEGSSGGIYIENKSSAIYKGDLTNITLKQFISYMSKNLDETLKSEDYEYNLSYTESSSISDYFDDNIFSIKNYFRGYYGSTENVYKSSVNIFYNDSLTKVNNYLGNFVYDTKEFRDFLKNKIKEQSRNYDNDNFEKYFDEYITSLNYAGIYFNTDASVTIHFFFGTEKMEYSFIKINIKELKPYIKPDNFYNYML